MRGSNRPWFIHRAAFCKSCLFDREDTDEVEGTEEVEGTGEGPLEALICCAQGIWGCHKEC